MKEAFMCPLIVQNVRIWVGVTLFNFLSQLFKEIFSQRKFLTHDSWSINIPNKKLEIIFAHKDVDPTTWCYVDWRRKMMINIACWIQFKRDITVVMMNLHQFSVTFKCLCAFSNFHNKVSYTFLSYYTTIFLLLT